MEETNMSIRTIFIVLFLFIILAAGTILILEKAKPTYIEKDIVTELTPKCTLVDELSKRMIIHRDSIREPETMNKLTYLFTNTNYYVQIIE